MPKDKLSQLLEKHQIIHIAGPRDYERTGVADYAHNLCYAQQKNGLDSIVLSANSTPPIEWKNPVDIAKSYDWP